MEKPNCWHIKKCGREPGGLKSQEMGVCPSALENSLDGVHSGKNGGRACWVVAATLCNGKQQGTFGQKYYACAQCSFYQQVRAEEGSSFKYSSVLQAMLKP